MYRETHLQKKSDECASSLEGVVTLVAKKALGAPDARRSWCKCCDEFSIMCHHEAKTNPRYKDMKSYGMNLLLRPLEDINDVTWSIVISLIILLMVFFTLSSIY